MPPFRVISLLAAYNEELFIAACLEHLEAQGIHAYLIDNESTDRTVEIAKQFLGRNLIGIETMLRGGIHSLGGKLERKQELALTLDAEWFIHQDIDEFRLPPHSSETLFQALSRADAAGYNCVEFDEFVFIPTVQAPDHEHTNFIETMQWYYPFRPRPLHRVNAWKKQPTRVNLKQHGGHCVLFEGQKLAPEHFKMRHYHFLSLPHAIRKLVGRPFLQAELDAGWHGWRPNLRAEMVTTLPSQDELTAYKGDDALIMRKPRRIHFIGELVEKPSVTEPSKSDESIPVTQMRVIALLAAYNEELYIAPCLEHLIGQGVEAYLIDNESTDRTLEIARTFLGRGLIGIETLPRHGKFRYRELLQRKQQLAHELDADWFIQHDIDEFRVAPRSHETLAQALTRVAAEGYNAVQFDEFVFVPTQQAPDHAHPNFVRTMRHYYALRPRPLHRLNAWRKQTASFDFVESSGHRVVFDGLRLYPESFKLRHYHFLSIPHAIEKYAGRVYVDKEVAQGWHSWRPQLRADMRFELPSQAELIPFTGDDALDNKQPRTVNYLGEQVQHALKQASPSRPFRVIALIAAYNAELYVKACIEHLTAHGVEVYLLDNESTDRTAKIARQFLGRGLLAVETLPRVGFFDSRSILARKQELAQTLDADWFIHQDIDELTLPPHARETLRQAIARVDAEGYSAIHFDEYEFIPTVEAPDHAHPDFIKTMLWYFPVELRSLHKVRAWKKQAAPVNLVASSGHHVLFEGRRTHPRAFKIKHYPYLSTAAMRQKYVRRRFPYGADAQGLHGWRLDVEKLPEFVLPAQSELHEFRSDDALTLKQPRRVRYLQEQVERARTPYATVKAKLPAPFIVGVGCSGAGLLRQMLNAHPQLAILPETGTHFRLYYHSLKGPDPAAVFLQELQVNPRADTWNLDLEALRARLAQLEPFSLTAALRAFYYQYAAQRGKTRWGEKTAVNLKHLLSIQTVLPEAHFVHIVRDGRAVSLSRQKMEFALPTLAQEALMWQVYVSQARALAPRLTHYLEVHFEDLVAQPEATLRRICEFVGLPYDAQMLEYPQLEKDTLCPSTNATASSSRDALLSQPPDPARISDWQAQLSHFQVSEIESLVGPTLHELGYSTLISPRSA